MAAALCIIIFLLIYFRKEEEYSVESYQINCTGITGWIRPRTPITLNVNKARKSKIDF